MALQPGDKQAFINVDINQAALLRVLQHAQLHLCDLHCTSPAEKRLLQQLLLRAASRPSN